MKVIVTGATGFVGKALVEHCIKDPAITSVVAMARKDIDAKTKENAKVLFIKHADFSKWPENPEDVAKLKGAEACLWAIGGKANDFPTVQDCRQAQNINSEKMAVAFIENLKPQESGYKFRFVFCGGKFAERDQEKKLWFMNDTRKTKGEAETGLIGVAEKKPDDFEAYFTRPSGITGKSGIMPILGGVLGFIKVDVLAAAMCSIAIESPSQQVFENDECVKLGVARQKAVHQLN